MTPMDEEERICEEAMRLDGAHLLHEKHEGLQRWAGGTGLYRGGLVAQW